MRFLKVPNNRNLCWQLHALKDLPSYFVCYYCKLCMTELYADNFTYSGTYRIGSSASNQQIQIWSGMLFGQFWSTFEVTADDCTPVTYSFFGDTPDGCKYWDQLTIAKSMCNYSEHDSSGSVKKLTKRVALKRSIENKNCLYCLTNNSS